MLHSIDIGSELPAFQDHLLVQSS